MKKPSRDGFVDRGGVRIYYAVFGDGPVTVCLLPTWALADMRVFRGNVDYLARHFRVIAFDPRGNGRSDRPVGARHYTVEEQVLDALAVFDATGTDKAALVSYSWGALLALTLSARYPERVHSAIYSAPAVRMRESDLSQYAQFESAAPAAPMGVEKFNAEHWRSEGGYRDFVEWFLEKVCSDPHSWKGRELGLDWALETDPETMVSTILEGDVSPPEVVKLCAAARVPAVVVIGDQDEVVGSTEPGVRFAEALGAHVIIAEGCGHPIHGRYAVWFNTLVRDFVDKTTPYHRGKFSERSTWRRGMHRPKRVIYLSSPIGLGHARRDVAIAQALREIRPGLEVDWLTQSPVDRILVPRGEKLLPESAHLLSEIDLFDAQTEDHCQPIFPIARNMDTVMVNNFHVFMEAMDARQYDLVIADEGWEVDYFLHEHPELKRAPFVWTTDVVGHLPTAGPGEPFDPVAPHPKDRAYEERMVADFNREMVSRMERFPHVRDLSLFVGNRDDIPEGSLGHDLPTIREHVDAYYEFCGYVLGFDPKVEMGNRDRLRDELGYRHDEKVCVVAVGGMAAGRNLLRRMVAAFPLAKRAIPELRMVVVAGPRIDPASLHEGRLPAGLEVHGFVHNLYRNMHACDLAVVHGGLTQTMDLVAAGVPFIVVPYLRQFEQDVWVRHRLRNYGATTYLDYRELRKEDGARVLVDALVELLRRGRRPYKPVEDNAIEAARMISQLL